MPEFPPTLSHWMLHQPTSDFTVTLAKRAASRGPTPPFKIQCPQFFPALATVQVYSTGIHTNTALDHHSLAINASDLASYKLGGPLLDGS